MGVSTQIFLGDLEMSRNARQPWEVEAYDGRVWRGWWYNTEGDARAAYAAATDGRRHWVHVRLIHRALQTDGPDSLMASRCVCEWHRSKRDATVRIAGD